MGEDPRDKNLICNDGFLDLKHYFWVKTEALPIQTILEKSKAVYSLWEEVDL